MQGAPEKDEAHTVDLLMRVRDVCRQISKEHAHLSHELHRLLQELSHPSVPSVEPELMYLVRQHASGPHYGECMRLVSANSNLSIAHAAFQAAVHEYPDHIWMLLWRGHQVILRYEPRKGESR